MKIVILYSLICFAGYLEAWGDLGHSTTAAIAQNYLNKNAVDNINGILEKYKGPDDKTFKSISEIATYPDEIRPYVPWANSYHYINMKIGVFKYDEATQCKDPTYCIVKALQNYTSVLRDHRITDINRLGEALSFTTHFMGDIFQPLHAGNQEDLGGNKIKIDFSTDWVIDEKSSELHWTWDHLILLHWRNTVLKTTDLNVVIKSFIDEIEAEQEFKNEQLKIIPNFVDMIEDSRDIVTKSIYSKINNYNLKNLSIEYYKDSIALAKRRVMQSGLQMSTLLNDIFDQRSNKANGFNFSFIYLTTFVFSLTLKLI